MTWKLKAHLEPSAINKDHASLCNVKARKWVGKKLVKTEVHVVSVHAFTKLTFAEQCGRCWLAYCAHEGIPVVRQR